MLVAPASRPDVADQFAAHLLWLSTEPMLPGRSFLMRIGTQVTPARVTTLKYTIDVDDVATHRGANADPE